MSSISISVFSRFARTLGCKTLTMQRYCFSWALAVFRVQTANLKAKHISLGLTCYFPTLTCYWRKNGFIPRNPPAKKEKKAVILAHNYQRPEIQDVADYVGDSIELSRKAAEEKDAKMIVFSAVDFMAESAAILNPDKKVLLPCLGARCPMAQMLTVDEIKRAKNLAPEGARGLVR